MSTEIFKQGAEAKLLLGTYNGQECLIKKRFVKKYRHPKLDSQITKERMKAESKAASRCLEAGIRTPKILKMDLDSREIYLEYFKNSITVKDYLNKYAGSENDDYQNKITNLCTTIGDILSKMHNNNIIHGDLTTSNMLIDPKLSNFDEYELILIDFGLSQYSQNVEDKGVDLYVLERALLSTHSDVPNLFSIILDAYKKGNEKSTEIITKFEEVRARGRKRTMVG